MGERALWGCAIGSAQAQTTVDLIVDPQIDNSGVSQANIVPDVNLVRSADLTEQTGQLGVRIEPDEVVSPPDPDETGFVEIHLANAELSETINSDVLSSSTGDTSIDEDCFESVQNASVESGGMSGDTDVTFEVPKIANCGGETTDDSTGSSVNEGLLQAVLPISLQTLANANFEVHADTAQGTILASTSYRAPEGGPLVEVDPRFRVEFRPDGVGTYTDFRDARTLALDQTSPFSHFKADGIHILPDVRDHDGIFDAALGRFSVQEIASAIDLQGSSASSAASIEVTVTAPKGANGIDFMFVSASPVRVLERVEGTRQFSGTASLDTDTIPFDLPFGVALTGEERVSEQTLVPEATITLDNEAGTEISAEPDSKLAPILREGIVKKFSWVPLEQAFMNRVFRISGFDRKNPPRIFVSVSGLNSDQGPTRGIELLSNIAPAGGEITFTGAQLGNILQSRGEVDLSRANVTRANVTITVETVAESVRVDSAIVDQSGSVSSGGTFDIEVDN